MLLDHVKTQGENSLSYKRPNDHKGHRWRLEAVEKRPLIDLAASIFEVIQSGFDSLDVAVEKLNGLLKRILNVSRYLKKINIW